MSSAAEKNSAFPLPPPPPLGPRRILYKATAILDRRGLQGDALLVDFDPLPRLLAVGPAEEIARHAAAAGAKLIPLPEAVILPGLVNAHTHLDLTHIGPRPHRPEEGFIPWVEMIRAERHLDQDSVARSITRGVELCLAGGTVAIGDIAGALPSDHDLFPWRILRDTGLLGVSFQEMFGIGSRLDAGRNRLEAILRHLSDQPGGPGELRFGLQPHAPYTVDLGLFLEFAHAAATHALPIATHLAESPEERRFIANADGPFRLLLEQLGIWDASVLKHIGRGRHPVEHLRPALEIASFAVAHLNDANDAAIEQLARTGTSVVYCPRASEYFAAIAHFGPHRYLEMIEAGVNVALGTDSIVNLPPEASDPASGGISILDEMRLLHTRDAAPPLLLLEMATTSGAVALGLPATWFEFTPGNELAGGIAVPLKQTRDLLGFTRKADTILQAVLEQEGGPSLLFRRNPSWQTRNERHPLQPASRLEHSP